MAEFKAHKQLLIFEKVARDLLDVVLRNKGNQETRWAISFLEALHSFIRNIGTFHEIYQQRAVELRASRQAKVEELSEVDDKILELEDSTFYMKVLGLVEIFSNSDD